MPRPMLVLDYGSIRKPEATTATLWCAPHCGVCAFERDNGVSESRIYAGQRGESASYYITCQKPFIDRLAKVKRNQVM